MHRQKSSSLHKTRISLFSILLAAIIIIPICPVGGQEPVTGGEELINWVARIKRIDYGIQLEWLYLENRIDFQPAQMKLVRSGRPLEFAPGYLYHGRDGLDEILISGRISGESYFTRAPHVWAVGAFHDEALSPAILMIGTEDFNALHRQGKAVLEAEIDRSAGVMDPYPKVPKEFSLEIVREIWIDEDTDARYRQLVQIPDDSLSGRDLELKKSLIRRRAEISFFVIQNLQHTRQPRSSFYPAAYEAVGAYFVGRGLDRNMPGFRAR